MRVAVVFESMFGNTHEVAEAIAQGVTAADPGAQVDLLRVGEGGQDRAAAADLLIVGGPTHIRSMTTGMSRRLGASGEQKKAPEERHELEPDAVAAGVRDWLEDLPKAKDGRRAAAFDTRIGARLAGGAAPGIARRLRRHGFEVLAEPEGFLVQDNGEGPLKDGELDRARAWGADLVKQVVAGAGHDFPGLMTLPARGGVRRH